MSALQSHVDDYLRLRRTLGYDLVETGRLLHRFAAELDAAGITHITTQIAVRWALAPKLSAPSSVPATRYRAVRGFARYMAGIDPETEIPPAGLIRRPRSRRPPFIYTDEELLALLEQARSSIPQPLRAATMHTLIGLLAATGLRIGEALRLDRGDIDWSRACCTSANQSSTNRDSCRSHPALWTRSSATHTSAIARDRPGPARASLSRSEVPA